MATHRSVQQFRYAAATRQKIRRALGAGVVLVVLLDWWLQST